MQRLTQEGSHVRPRQGIPSLSGLFGDDSPAGFDDGGIAAPL
jgi:hypothetical protein